MRLRWRYMRKVFGWGRNTWKKCGKILPHTIFIVPMYWVRLFGGLLSPKLVENMEVITGGLDAEYG